MHKNNILLVLLFCVYGITKAQMVGSLVHLEDRFMQQSMKQPSEKVYLKTDKSSYVGGEDVWIRAFLADGTFHESNALSHLLYVELYNPGDRLIKRVLLRMQDSLICGNIHLPDTITPGRYTLKAYTNWMQNFGTDYHFTKAIDIFNGNIGVNVQTSYIKEGNDATVRIAFIDNNGLPYTGTTVSFDYYSKEKLFRSRNYRTDKEGGILVPFALTDSLSRLEYSFYRSFPFTFQSTLNIPRLDDDFDITFHPEGGALLLGVRQRIAFKAIDSNGNSLSVTGKVLSPQKELLSSFKSEHRGMGTFFLTATHDIDYVVEVTSDRGFTKTFLLPRPLKAGYALSVDTISSAISLSALRAHFTSSRDSLRVLFHTRGNLLGAMDVPEDFNCIISPKDFPAGILHAVLLTRNNEVLSERLLFIADQSGIKTEVKTDSLDYAPFSNLNVQISVCDSLGNPLRGNYAISVTDDQFVRVDSVENNLLSHYLLQSDLRGNIEAVGSYMYESSKNIDLLMLTHGWTRFNVSQLLSNDSILAPKYELERSQSLSGVVMNEFTEPIRKGKVLVCANRIGVWGQGQADEMGRFTIRNLSFPDSTLVHLRGTRPKGGKYGIKIKLEYPDYLHKSVKWPSPICWAEEINKNELNAGFKGRYIIQNGEKVYVFKDFEVRGSKTRIYREDPRSREERVADHVLDVQSMIKLFPSASVVDLVRRLPYVHAFNGKVYLGNQELAVYINGVEHFSEDLYFLIKERLVSISLISSPWSVASLGLSKAAIVIRTVDDYYNFPKDEGLLKCYPLGYLVPDEFYVPKYETAADRIADEEFPRRTLYWNPHIRLEQGVGSFSFPTSKGNTRYTLYYEGITDDGKLFMGKGKIRIRGVLLK